MASEASIPEGARSSNGSRPHRVVQWATGNIGTRSLRGVIEHPNMTLAGVHVHSPAKVGRDAGDLCGLPSVGVTATDDIEAILTLNADCVLYMPLALNADEVCRLLAAGTNVVTTRGEFHHPPSMDAALREQVETACKQGGSSIHSTGSSPGFITEAIPLALSSIQRRLDRLTIDEYADLSQRDTPDILFDIMGFGRAPGEFEQWRLDYLKSSFGPSLSLVAESLGVPLESVEAHGELATSRTTIDIAAGIIPAGTTAAQRITISGMRNGLPLLQFRATWYCSTDVDADWNMRDTGWHVSVDGDAPLEVDLLFSVPLERMAEMAPAYTANRAINAVPHVIAAEPGIRTTLDLPQVTAQL